MNNVTDIIFLLDHSGSMHNVQDATIRGFNDFVDEQKTVPGDARLTLILFDDQYQTVHDAVYLPEIPALTSDTYFPRGMTALRDAVGKAILQASERIASTPDSHKPARVLFVINTDGQENSSTEFSSEQVAALIRECEGKGWTFLYLGATLSAFHDASTIGISARNTVQVSSLAHESGATFGAISQATCACRTKGIIPDGWADSISTTGSARA